MPGNLLDADLYFPHFTTETNDEKIDKISSYLFILLEQLKYSMGNLGAENFNETEFDSIVNMIREPIYLQIQDEDDKITQLQVTAEGLAGSISDAEGNITTLTAMANTMQTRITDAEGNISTMQQTAQSLTSRITSAEGSVSEISQTVNGQTLSVSDTESSTIIKLMSGSAEMSSEQLHIKGMVTISDLSTKGLTTINGGNITTGEIEAISLTGNTITGGTITGTTFTSTLDSLGRVGGEIRFRFADQMWEAENAGGIRMDSLGSGDYEAPYRMILYTNTVDAPYNRQVSVAMKLQAAGGFSITTPSTIYIYAASSATIESPTIYLRGNVYRNGVLL